MTQTHRKVILIAGASRGSGPATARQLAEAGHHVVLGAQQFGGGVVTTDGTNTIHTFTTSGTLSPLSSLTAQYLVVAGGGGTSGNRGGGGGGGGLLTGTGLTIDTNSNYVVTVGAGGAGGGGTSSATSAQDGSGSSFLAYSATGGGGGANAAENGRSSGSGGGGGASSTVAGSGGAGNTPSTSPSQGSNGGAAIAYNTTPSYGAGGGGGAGGSATSNGSSASGTTAGNGANGTASSISGSSVTYAGGGGGGGGGSNASGGSGGGGAGAYGGGTGLPTTQVAGTSGTANTGGGGGGGSNYNTTTVTQSSGGSGIVIIAYPGSTQQMSGGTVTISGGNVIHTFTSSGYLTPIKYASRSLRFRSSASAYISRTPATTTNRRTWTWSGWVKRGALGSVTRFFSADNGAQQTLLRFQADNTLQFQIYNSGVAAQIITTQVFRDPSAWYHIVAVMNTTDATSANRMVLYINGVQVTALSTASYPSQNYDAFVNQTILHSTSSSGTAEYWDGYLTEVNFVDGAALTPSSFGTFNSYGVWQPITYGGSYGTNGFYLTFGNNTSTTTLGYDTSPQGNNWTTNNISLTAGVTYDSMTDVPTLTSATVTNYCVLNPLWVGSGITTSNANLTATASSSANSLALGTIAVSSGKWYWESTIVSGSSMWAGGVVNPSIATPNYTSLTTGNSYAYNNASTSYNGQTGTTYGATYTTNDVIGTALDLDTGTITFYKNGVSQGVAYTGISGTFTPMILLNTSSISINFGQRPFSYTPPSGFVALNTYNLSTPTIPNGATQMAATLWTGDGTSSRTIVNSVNGTSFQPDWVWWKNRTTAKWNQVFDSVRGADKALSTNATDAEDASGGYGGEGSVTAFNSNGYTLQGGTGNNENGSGIVGWSWKANGAGVSNTSGSITSTVSANTTAGFSVVTYTGTGANATVGHGLGVAPSMIIAKSRSISGAQWAVYTTTLGASAFINLDSTAAATTGNTSVWQGVSPTSTVFSVSTSNQTNGSAATYVAYAFSAVAGYSAFGSYTGNGSTDGPFVFLGFRPRFVLVKNASTAGKWVLMDTSRGLYNEMTGTNALYPNLADAEGTDGGSRQMDFLSNGFKLRCTGGDANGSGNTIIYMAFAENPFKYANAR